MYNVRVKRFLNTEQIQIFSEPILSSGSEREDKRPFSRETGEIFPANSKWWRNIFTGEEDYYRKMGDPEENLRRSFRRTKNSIYDIAKCNKWEWFFTLTFNPEKVDSFDYSETTKKLSVWLNNMRKKCPQMKYIVVPELHKSGRWHFHGLFANVEDMVFVDSKKRDKKGRIIYNVGNYKLGFSTATQVEDELKAVSYIGKYITKELCEVTKNKKRYWSSRNVDMPMYLELNLNLANDELLKAQKKGYVKKVYSDYLDVEYIELPIGVVNVDAMIASSF